MTTSMSLMLRRARSGHGTHGVEELAAIYNIGTGSGTSVLEVMLAVKRMTGIDFDYEIGPPRAGDPARVCREPSGSERSWVGGLVTIWTTLFGAHGTRGRSPQRRSPKS